MKPGPTLVVVKLSPRIWSVAAWTGSKQTGYGPTVHTYAPIVKGRERDMVEECTRRLKGGD